MPVLLLSVNLLENKLFDTSRQRENYAQRLGGVPKIMLDSSTYSVLFLYCFFGAVVHSLCSHFFLSKSRTLRKKGKSGSTAQVLCELLGHHTFIFAIWLLPSLFWIGSSYGTDRVTEIFSSADLTEPFANFTYIFLALSKAVRRIFIELVNTLSKASGGSETSWWFHCLLSGGILAGMISEPAVMVLVCSALAHRYYAAKPSSFFCYSTLAITFFVIALGDLAIPFNITASLELSSNWGWDHWLIASSLGWRAALIALSILSIGAIVHHKELSKIKPQHDDAEDGVSFFAITGYLAAFIIAGAFHQISFLLVSIVALVCILERDIEGQSHTERLNLPLLIALFNYSMEVHAYLLSPWVMDLYNTQGANLEGLTIVFSALNEHLPGMPFISTFSMENTSVQGFELMMLVLGAGLTLFATSINVLATKILRSYFPHEGISGLRFLAYSLPIAVFAFLVLKLTYVLIP